VSYLLSFLSPTTRFGEVQVCDKGEAQNFGVGQYRAEPGKMDPLSAVYNVAHKIKEMSDNIHIKEVKVGELLQRVEFLRVVLERSKEDDDTRNLIFDECNRLKTTLDDCLSFMKEVQEENIAAKGLTKTLTKGLNNRMDSADTEAFRKMAESTSEKIPVHSDETTDESGEAYSDDQEGPSGIERERRTRAKSLTDAATAKAAAAAAAATLAKKKASRWWAITRKAAHTITEARDRIDRAQCLIDRLKDHEAKINFASMLESLARQKDILHKLDAIEKTQKSCWHWVNCM